MGANSSKPDSEKKDEEQDDGGTVFTDSQQNGNPQEKVAPQKGEHLSMKLLMPVKFYLTLS